MLLSKQWNEFYNAYLFKGQKLIFFSNGVIKKDIQKLFFKNLGH